jgi:hypothetical protein
MRHMAHLCVAFAPESSGFVPEMKEFCGRNQRSNRQYGEKPRYHKGLRAPHTLAHDVTEVTHRGRAEIREFRCRVARGRGLCYEGAHAAGERPGAGSLPEVAGLRRGSAVRRPPHDAAQARNVTVTVPVHTGADVGRGLAVRILKDAGFSVEDYLRLR